MSIFRAQIFCVVKSFIYKLFQVYFKMIIELLCYLKACNFFVKIVNTGNNERIAAKIYTYRIAHAGSCGALK